MIIDYVIVALVVLSIAATCVLLVYEKKGRTLLYEVRHQMEAFHKIEMDHIWATASLHKTLGHLAAPLPVAGGWALGSDTLAFLHAKIIHEAPHLVVELGSGLSTVVLADALRKVHGRLISVEADARYFEVARRQLVDAGLVDAVTLIHAPLEACAGSESEWYQQAALAGISNVDMLLVDGPPATTCPTVRYPALPFFRAKLAPRAWVVLDDCGREGEQKVVERWRREFPRAQVQMLPLSRPVALIRMPDDATTQ